MASHTCGREEHPTWHGRHVELTSRKAQRRVRRSERAAVDGTLRAQPLGRMAHLRGLLALLLSPTAIFLAACSPSFAPQSGVCDEDPPPYYACEGSVLVTSECNGGFDPTTTRVDCAANGLVCVAGDRTASCVRPCDSNAICDSGQYCSQRGYCMQSGVRSAVCETSNAQSCAAGLSCLLEHHVCSGGAQLLLDPTCNKTCSLNSDCGTYGWCSALDLTDQGAKTCQDQNAWWCDPANPQSCSPDEACTLTIDLPDGGASGCVYTCRYRY